MLNHAQISTLRNFYKHRVRLQIMDFLTVGLSAFLSALSSICLMFLFYRLWILPYLTDLTESVPAKAKALIAPYVDEKLLEVQKMIDERIAEVSQSVKKSTARFQRSVNQAAEYLGMDEGLDLESEDGIERATQKASKRYGVDIAVEAVNQLIAALAAKQKANEPDGKKAITTQGGTTIW